MEVTYSGDLRTHGVHLKSGEKLVTDAPVDNNGKGANYSPTDLLCSALASCMLTIMGIVARNHQLNIEGSRAEIEKVMGTDPRRVVEIRIKMTIPSGVLTQKEKHLFEVAAKNCPVAKSLHADLKQTIEFVYN